MREPQFRIFLLIPIHAFDHCHHLCLTTLSFTLDIGYPLWVEPDDDKCLGCLD